jgi:hypothetical protein
MIPPIIMIHHNQMDLNHHVIHTVKRRQHKPRAKKTTKRVSFAPDITAMETMCIDDYTMEEIDRTWYTEEDMLRISEECFLILEKTGEKTSLRKSERYCFRGLEPHSKIGSILKNKSRQTAIKLVLEEQQRLLKRKGVADIDSLYKVYHNTTSSSQMWAQVVGSRDHHNAESYLDDHDDIEYMVYTMEQQTFNGWHSRALSDIAPPDNNTRNEVIPRAA